MKTTLESLPAQLRRLLEHVSSCFPEGPAPREGLLAPDQEALLEKACEAFERFLALEATGDVEQACTALDEVAGFLQQIYDAEVLQREDQRAWTTGSSEGSSSSPAS